MREGHKRELATLGFLVVFFFFFLVVFSLFSPPFAWLFIEKNEWL